MVTNSSNKMTNILLVLLSVSVIATIGTILYHFVDTSYQTETAIRATADESKIFDGVYVRNETVLTYSGSGAVSYQVPDGGKIASGDVIAEVYPDESAIESQQKIDALQETPTDKFLKTDKGAHLQSRYAGTGAAGRPFPADHTVL